MVHIPVLQKEVLQYLNPKPNKNFIDCTFGGGGHADNVLERIGPKGKILGIDRDSEILNGAELKDRIIFVCDNFVNLKDIVKKEKFGPVQGILFDLGYCSWHLEKSERGFSFLINESLDMRYDPQSILTAEKIINSWPEKEIETILRELGEERFAKRIARGIISQRTVNPIKTTFQLIEAIKKAVPFWYQRKKIHFATKTFQALRITVNNELDNLKEALPQALEILEPGGRLVVISFHSLEDRIIKNFFKSLAKEGSLKILTKKPVIPTLKELKVNPRSRSAKLRAAQKQ
ncbi:MAG TPA: 16S rRNA (cytosine(1402)-N(4))-methyltransferase RsmH [Candidatus Parcubacteria bacterium]|nr:16S rRNA (cytosine(1402)-N(4))-methyltransferase RsmH [Candidatus Parcubacteria bacterium]